MKKLFLAVAALMVTVFSAEAQVRLESPHPDFEVKITRCAYASGTVIIDMVMTNYGNEDAIKLGDRDIFAYDDEGNSYNVDNMKILYGPPNKPLEASRYGIEFRLPQDIPLKYRVQLEGVSTNASRFSLLTLGFTSNGILALSHEKPLKIRNLEWAK